jgi:nitrogen regulatory protein PII
MSNVVKMVMISYNEAIDTEVMEVLKKCALKNYTKIMAAFGQGETSGIHLGNDIWPGRNNILYIVCQDKEAKQILTHIKELRNELGKEGVKAFVWNLEEIT